MDPRAKLILETSVEDFIENARPITSGYLYKKYNFGIKPAMIRRELSNLDESGHLSQIHTSSGRVPTNKAYRFFVKNLKSENLEPDVSEKQGREMIKELMDREMNLFTKLMSEYLDTLSAVYEPHQNEFFVSGLENLFRSVKDENKNELRNIIHDFEMLPDRLFEKASELEEDRGFQVFIGKSPVTKSEYLSLISGKFSTDEDEIVLITIGPRRMDYRKSLCIYKFFEDETKS